MIELYRRNIWHDAKTVNMIATALFSKTTKVEQYIPMLTVHKSALSACHIMHMQLFDILPGNGGRVEVLLGLERGISRQWRWGQWPREAKGASTLTLYISYIYSRTVERSKNRLFCVVCVESRRQVRQGADTSQSRSEEEQKERAPSTASPASAQCKMWCTFN